MKKLLCRNVAALGTSAPAIAADMAARPAAARPVAFTNWSGCYVGGDVGNSWGHSSGYSATPASTFGITDPRAVPQVQLSQSFDMTGFTGGFYGGCQAQFGVWVIGLEGDWSLNNKEGQAFGVGGPSSFFL